GGLPLHRRSQVGINQQVALQYDGMSPDTSFQGKVCCMVRSLHRLVRCVAVFSLFCTPLWANAATADARFNHLAKVSPGLDREVLRHALAAMQCAVNNGAA